MPSYPRSDSTTYTQDATWRELIDVTSSYVYVGRSMPIYSNTAEAVFQISRISLTNPYTTSFADGDDRFDNVWANRVSLTYI